MWKPGFMMNDGVGRLGPVSTRGCECWKEYFRHSVPPALFMKEWE